MQGQSPSHPVGWRTACTHQCSALGRLSPHGSRSWWLVRTDSMLLPPSCPLSRCHPHLQPVPPCMAVILPNPTSSVLLSPDPVTGKEVFSKHTLPESGYPAVLVHPRSIVLPYLCPVANRTGILLSACTPKPCTIHPQATLLSPCYSTFAVELLRYIPPMQLTHVLGLLDLIGQAMQLSRCSR